MTTLTRRRAALLPALGALLFIGACDSILGPRSNTLMRDQLERGEAVWQERGITSYTMIVERGSPFQEGYRRVLIEVVDGAIQAGTYLDDETPVPAAELARHQTVPQLFALIRDALDRRAPGMFVRYEPTLGHPDVIQIDYDPTRTDDDIFISVSELTPAAS
jgi:hypothetical protein